MAGGSLDGQAGYETLRSRRPSHDHRENWEHAVLVSRYVGLLGVGASWGKLYCSPSPPCGEVT